MDKPPTAHGQCTDKPRVRVHIPTRKDAEMISGAYYLNIEDPEMVPGNRYSFDK